MSDSAALREAVREKVLAEPDVILDDPDVMRALVAANDKAMGANVVDLRGIAMERLETRLTRLEETHRSVIAAAYENLSGTNQIHRAILCLLEPVSFDGFLEALTTEAAAILRIESAVLVLETTNEEAGAALMALGPGVQVRPVGHIDAYLTRGRQVPVRQVTLRQVSEGQSDLYGSNAGFIRSEACLQLDLGDGRMKALLVLGSEDPHQFAPAQGTDLLAFFAGTVERAIRRWLA